MSTSRSKWGGKKRTGIMRFFESNGNSTLYPACADNIHTNSTTGVSRPSSSSGGSTKSKNKGKSRPSVFGFFSSSSSGSCSLPVNTMSANNNSNHPQNGHHPHLNSIPEGGDVTLTKLRPFKNGHHHPTQPPDSTDPENGELMQQSQNGFSPSQIPPEKFYMNVKSEEVASADIHPFFERRDFNEELKIVSSKGTVRGFRNRVRASITSFLETGEKKKKNYRLLEKGKIVVYTTSMRIIRDTYEKCKKVKNIIHTNMVQYEERDIFMSQENQEALRERLECDSVVVPQVFADGQHLGGAERLEYLNEIGELRKIFRHFKKIAIHKDCTMCGGYRYIPCTTCHGSKKSLIRNHFTEEFQALRCMQCDENGLVRCELCNHCLQ